MAMTEKQAQVIQMRAHGMSFREIAQELGLSEMAVRTRAKRGQRAGERRDVIRRPKGLTAAQLEALELMARLGSVNKVADELGRNQVTIRTRLLHAARKLGVDTIAEAVDAYRTLTAKHTAMVDAAERGAALRKTILDFIGETTITGKNQVNLPAQGLRRLGWERGDRLLVALLGDDIMLLLRRPTSWAEAFAGKMGDVFGTHEDTLRFLDEERRSWEEWAEDRGI